MMKAVVLRRYGSNDGVDIADVPPPVPGPRDVLIEARAVSINPVDFKIRNGMLKPLAPYRLPIVMGNDVAGVVTACGNQVQRFRVGDSVYASADKMRLGAFAEQVALEEETVARMPAGMSFEDASALPLVALTAWQALHTRARLQLGERVLIHAGAGGVGTVAIQIAKHLGAWVATTASAANRQLVTELGADAVVDYRTEDFSRLCKDLDVVFDTQGGDVLRRSFTVLRPGGRLVTIGGMPDYPTVHAMQSPWYLQLALWVLSWPLLWRARQHKVRYSYLFREPIGADLENISQLVESGVLKPVIDRVLPFDQIKEALDHVEAGHARGKVVVHIR